MTTLADRIQALGLAALQGQTQFQLVMTLRAQAANTGAYVALQNGRVTVTTDACDSAQATVDQLAAILATSHLKSPQDVALSVRLTLPEPLFARLYQDLEGRKLPEYRDFRTTLYKQWLAILAERSQDLARELGGPIQLGLVQAKDRIITAVALLNLPVTASPAGITAATLDWLNATLWQAVQAPDARTLAARSASARLPVAALPQALTQPQAVLPGFAALDENTQRLAAAAFEAGLAVRVHDAGAAVMSLQRGATRQLVVQGVTALNTAAVQAVGASKLAQKALLGAAGLKVPRAAKFTDAAAAMAAYDAGLKNKSLVVKPNCGHHGQGVTVFMLPPTRRDFAQAVTAASAFGAVLVELFVPGNSYRFFVLNRQVLAVLECEPASVVGDGRQTVADLAKRRHLVLGPTEQAVLTSQGKTGGTVPPRGHEVFLRFNSNLTTGGRGVAVTADIAPGYKALAVAAAAAVGATVAGVDIAIPNLYLEPTIDHPEAAQVLAVTPDPRLAVHEAPVMGAGVNVAAAVIAALFPPIKKAAEAADD
ncbi:hypothetical protein [Lacticaseibacillus parakribbianus]|uniref:hypothetical protein n=1 Tax=Lacticaseibacillus parakribbianus TaxID=2970927 RepID=UPI0021CB057D|nr:hypothetical protein [Lacticaseibacillus parakribbianus]